MTQLFISYRNADTYGITHALHHHLQQEFGEDSLVLDVRAKRAGEDFVAGVQDAVTKSDLLICLIGRQWLMIEDEHGRRMLHNPEDAVRVQLATALAADVPVLPVLVRDAPMPTSNDLPDDLKPLARLQAFNLTDRVSGDLKNLVDLIKAIHKNGRKSKQAAVYYHHPPGPGDTGPSPVLLPPAQSIHPPADQTPLMDWKGTVNFEESNPAVIRSIVAIEAGKGDQLTEKFLGEIGVEAVLYHDVPKQLQPLTLEVWLFDRANLSATTLVIASPAATADPTTMLRAARRGKIVPAVGEMKFAVESEGLYGEVGVSNMAFSGDVANLYIRSAQFGFRVWPKPEEAKEKKNK
jgi:hypothetical protein